MEGEEEDEDEDDDDEDENTNIRDEEGFFFRGAGGRDFVLLLGFASEEEDPSKEDPDKDGED